MHFIIFFQTFCPITSLYIILVLTGGLAGKHLPTYEDSVICPTSVEFRMFVCEMKDGCTVLANDRYHELKEPWTEPAYLLEECVLIKLL
jgi:hypothetical protein